MFIPVACTCCGRPDVTLCAGCVAQLQPADGLVAPPGVDRVVALVDYVSVGRDLVLALKYRDARALVPVVAGALADLITADLLTADLVGACAPIVDVVTWAPTSARRRHERGYDQAQLVARSLGRQLHRPTRRLLVRSPGPPQTGRSRRERLDGPRFRARGAVPPRVLIVDDVITSGATISSAAHALRQAGAVWVFAAALARTPDLGRTHDPPVSRRA